MWPLRLVCLVQPFARPPTRRGPGGPESLSRLFTLNVPAKRDKTLAGTHVKREMWCVFAGLG